MNQWSIASYQVSELIAQNMKAHTLGESIILPACKKIVSTMLGNEAALKITKISLSDDTVCKRILEISSDIEKNVSKNKLQCSDFALQGYGIYGHYQQGTTHSICLFHE